MCVLWIQTQGQNPDSGYHASLASTLPLNHLSSPSTFPALNLEFTEHPGLLANELQGSSYISSLYSQRCINSYLLLWGLGIHTHILIFVLTVTPLSKPSPGLSNHTFCFSEWFSWSVVLLHFQCKTSSNLHTYSCICISSCTGPCAYQGSTPTTELHPMQRSFKSFKISQHPQRTFVYVGWMEKRACIAQTHIHTTATTTLGI